MTPDADQLALWLNPVYGRAISKFVSAAIDLYRRGSTVVMLTPARTDTAWWQMLHKHAEEIRLIRGRLKFEHPDGTKSNPAPFPSAVVVLRPGRTAGDAGPKYSILQPSHYIAKWGDWL